jgi:hypothetical protein
MPTGNGTAEAGSCTGGPWTEPKYAGAQAGTEFCHTKFNSGLLINGIEVWSDKKIIEAIQFYYSDGSNSGQIGKSPKEKEHKRLDWDSATDGLSSVKLWTDKKGENLGRITIRTKKGGELTLGKQGKEDPIESPTNTGMLLGVSGRADDTIKGLSFLFMGSAIDKMSLEDVKFEDTPEELNKRMEGMQMMILDYADHTNGMTDSNETFTFGKTETRTTSKEYSTTQTHTIGAKQSWGVTGTLLGVVGATSTTELSYSYANAHTESNKQEKSVALNYVVATMLKPGQRVYCRATAMFAEYKGDYTATVSSRILPHSSPPSNSILQMHIKLEDGTEWKFRSDGSMEQIAWSQASSKCQSGPFPDDGAVPTSNAPPAAGAGNSTTPATPSSVPAAPASPPARRAHPRALTLPYLA